MHTTANEAQTGHTTHQTSWTLCTPTKLAQIHLWQAPLAFQEDRTHIDDVQQTRRRTNSSTRSRTSRGTNPRYDARVHLCQQHGIRGSCAHGLEDVAQPCTRNADENVRRTCSICGRELRKQGVCFCVAPFTVVHARQVPVDCRHGNGKALGNVASVRRRIAQQCNCELHPGNPMTRTNTTQAWT